MSVKNDAGIGSNAKIPSAGVPVKVVRGRQVTLSMTDREQIIQSTKKSILTVKTHVPITTPIKTTIGES